MKEKEIRKKVIDLYDSNPQDKLAVIKMLELPKKIKGKNVLDAGCGAGMQFFDYVFSGANVTGIDQSTKSISFIKQQCEQLNYSANLIIGDIEKTNFSDGKFDYVFSIGVLHHTPNILNALKEFKRLTKPNGEIRILLYHKYSLEAIIRRFICFTVVSIPAFKKLIPYKVKQTINWWDAYENPLWKTYSKKEITELCDEIGLAAHCHVTGTVLGRLGDMLMPPLIKRIIEHFYSKNFGWFLIVECKHKR